jgi:hypothetical protein
MSRRSKRNRGRSGQVVKARGPAPAQGMVTLSGPQIQALLAAGQQNWAGQMATPLPRPPSWSTVPFAPGRPLPPALINQPRPGTGRAEPRLFELPISTNLNFASMPYVPWRILRQAADMPLFRKCIQRRKGVCELDWTVTLDPKAVAREAAASGQADKDVEKAMRAKFMPDIIRVSDWLETPDQGNGFEWPQWAGLVFENMLKFDAVAIYPRLTYGGDLFALEVLDGSTIKPLLDERGGRPLPPAPFAQQILYGYPRGEYTADAEIGADGKPYIPGGMSSDELVYERRIIRENTPYGMSATEIALWDGILWMRRMGWLMAEYTHGVSGAMLETDSEVGWDVPQWELWLTALNDKLGGNTNERLQWSLLPPGTKAVLPEEVAERYKPDMDMFLIKLVAGDFGMTATELGFPEVGSLGASFHEGEEDVLNRVTRMPDANWLAGLGTKLATRYLAMPPVLQVQILGLESEDEAAADAVALQQIQSGRMTLNQDNERRGMPSYDFDEANMPMLQTARGVVFLEGASKTAQPGTLIGPAMAPPTSVPPGSGPPEQDDDDGQDDGEATLASKSAELGALKKWLARHPDPARPFACKALTAADAPGFAGDSRVVFKADGDGDPKASAGRGLAGIATKS